MRLKNVVANLKQQRNEQEESLELLEKDAGR